MNVLSLHHGDIQKAPACFGFHGAIFTAIKGSTSDISNVQGMISNMGYVFKRNVMFLASMILIGPLNIGKAIRNPLN